VVQSKIQKAPGGNPSSSASIFGRARRPTRAWIKERLAELFQRDRSVNAAYLTRVAYADKSFAVVLCLRSQFGADRGLAEKVGNIFASMFGGHEHLDIVFLSEAQEIELVKVSKPFFQATEGV
jgi:hypothetical protein